MRICACIMFILNVLVHTCVDAVYIEKVLLPVVYSLVKACTL